MAAIFSFSATFKAIDKMTAPIKAMTNSIKVFGVKASNAFAKIQRRERAVRKGFSKMLGVVGKLGLGMSALTIATQIATANIDLEKNLASLSAITGVVGKNFDAFTVQIDKVSKSQKVFAGNTAKAFEVIGSAKPELLANAEALGIVTDAAITLSKATGEELAVSADSLTGTLNQFNLGANESLRVINALAAGAQAGAAAVPLITESLTVFGTVADSMNVSVEESIGLIETLAEKNIKGAEAGTKLRNVLTNITTVKALPPKALKQLEKFGVNLDLVADSTIPFKDRLAELSKIQNDSTALLRVFGKENLVAGQILLQNVAKVDQYTNAVTGSNVALQQAEINSNTLSNRWAELVASFKNATTSTDQNNKALNTIKNTLKFVGDNMTKIVSVTLTVIKVFAIYKASMIAFTVITNAYNIATKAATAIQWLWNAALSANPISLIIIGIAALVAGVILLIKNWKEIVTWVKTSDNVFAKLIRSALWPIVALFKTIKKAWVSIVEAFKTGGMAEGFKQIGRSILSFLLLPLEGVLRVVNKITGGKMGGEFLEKIASFREELTSSRSEGKPLNPEAEMERVKIERSEKTTNNKLAIDINDENGRASVTKNTGNIPISIKPTVG